MTTPVAPPHAHYLLVGDAGSGKSTLAAQILATVGPSIVFIFDAHGKDEPYVRVGALTQEDTDELGTPRKYVLNAAGEIILQLEYYLDQNPEAPEAYKRFRARLHRFGAEADEWSGIGTDSVTMMEMAARNYDKFVLNKGHKEPRSHYAASTEALELVLMGRYAAFPRTVVVVAHVDEDKDEQSGMMVRNPAVPGRLRKRLAGGYTELYRCHTTLDPKSGALTYHLQTRAGGGYNAMSTKLNAPNPCVPTTQAIWSNVPNVGA